MADETNDLMPGVRIVAACERVLQERDNVISLVRLVDSFTLIAEPQTADAVVPDQMPPLTVSFSGVPVDGRKRCSWRSRDSPHHH